MKTIQRHQDQAALIEALERNDAMTARQFYRRDEASEYLKLTYAIQASRQYLAKMAVIGGGPRFHKAGRWPIYSKCDLDGWAVKRLGLPVESTAEYSRAARSPLQRPAPRSTR